MIHGEAMLHEADTRDRRLLDELRGYVHDVLDAAVVIDGDEPLRRLPAYLQDLYNFYPARVMDRRLVLVVPHHGSTDTPAVVAKHRDQLRRHLDHDLVVFVAASLGADDRRRLIAKRVPFVVPGNQMFLPELAIDLREHFRLKPAARSGALSPAAQLLVIAVLLGHKLDGQAPAALAARYGYSRMTMGRAVDELRALELADVETSGKPHRLTMRRRGRDLWAHVRPLLRSPVRKRRRIPAPPPAFGGLLAGETALGALTDLSPPAVEARAIASSDWETLARHYDLDRAPSWDESVIELETWAYDPAVLGAHGVVDPLSLWASIPDDPDERLGQAKDALLMRIVP